MGWTRSITVISKEEGHMEKLLSRPRRAAEPLHPFWVIVGKEMADHIRSWRFIILLSLIGLTCFGSLYTGLNNIGTPKAEGTAASGSFFFLQLFTATDGTLRSEEHTSELQSR